MRKPTAKSFPWHRIAETIVRSEQGRDVSAIDKVVTGLCHYPGQSQPVSGLERRAMECPNGPCGKSFCRPGKRNIKKCGGLGVMATYPAIDGMPTHASKRILTGILRQDFGFDGLVLSEGGGIGTLIYEGLAPTQKEAGALALAAGVDVGISFESGYMQDLLANVREGKCRWPWSIAVCAASSSKSSAWVCSTGRWSTWSERFKIVHRPEHQDLALEAARQAIVLLKNEGQVCCP